MRTRTHAHTHNKKHSLRPHLDADLVVGQLDDTVAEERLDFRLDFRLGELSSNQSLDLGDGVRVVGPDLRHGGLTDVPLAAAKRDKHAANDRQLLMCGYCCQSGWTCSTCFDGWSPRSGRCPHRHASPANGHVLLQVAGVSCDHCTVPEPGYSLWCLNRRR